MANLTVNYSEVLSVDFFVNKSGYGGASVIMKTSDGNRAYVRYEWEADSIDQIPSEVVDFLVSNGLSLEQSLDIS